jgi:CheY-like chemotaxis protein
MTMPRLAGDEVTLRLRETAPDLPIVVMSGFTEADLRQRFGDVPHLWYLQKPFRLPALIELLRKVLPQNNEQ